MKLVRTGVIKLCEFDDGEFSVLVEFNDDSTPDGSEPIDAALLECLDMLNELFEFKDR